LLLVTVTLSGESGSVLRLIPGLFINGIGTGFAVAPLASNVLSRIAAQHAGAASGVLTTALQVGNAVGVAIIGVIFYGALNGQAPPPYAHAFALGLIYLILTSLVLAALVQFLPAEREAS
jgi:predicted MFS family arabinose efflux permease